MRYQVLFQNVIGLTDMVRSPPTDQKIPTAISEALLWNEKLPESILETDLRLLDRDHQYSVDSLTIFAEESQCVVRWAFTDIDSDAGCFVLDNETPANALLEEFNLSESIYGMLVNNTLSSSLLQHFRYETLPAESAAMILRNIAPVGGFSNIKAILHNGIACTLEVGDELFVSAASHSEEKLDSFIEHIKGGPDQKKGQDQKKDQDSLF